MLRVYLSKSQFESGSTKPEVVRSTPLTGAQWEAFTKKGKNKVRNSLIGYSLKPSRLFMIGCP